MWTYVQCNMYMDNVQCNMYMGIQFQMTPTIMLPIKQKHVMSEMCTHHHTSHIKCGMAIYYSCGFISNRD